MLKKTIRYLGIDWGEKRIGLALGDSETGLASPLKTVNSIEGILKIIEEEKIDRLIVGKPLSIADQRFPTAKRYDKFISFLAKRTNLPLETIDERLSSKAADALAGDRKNKAERDAVAAMIILQSYLDQQIDLRKNNLLSNIDS